MGVEGVPLSTCNPDNLQFYGAECRVIPSNSGTSTLSQTNMETPRVPF